MYQAHDCLCLDIFLARLLALFHFFFFFNDTATTEIYTLSLHDALPICRSSRRFSSSLVIALDCVSLRLGHKGQATDLDRKSTRLNSSHANISYAVFCLKKKRM